MYSVRALLVSSAIALCAFQPVIANAGPGAHGPNGEHLDSSAATLKTSGLSPRFEAQSELYEVVGTLLKEELSLLIDRFETNVPVRKATVEVAIGNLKAQAKYHDDVGDFSIDDETLLKELWKKGTHPLVISIIEEADSDLIDVKLNVGDEVVSHHHFDYAHVGTALLGLLAALALIVVMRKRKMSLKFRQGGLR
jgi:hypothetical protein